MKMNRWLMCLSVLGVMWGSVAEATNVAVVNVPRVSEQYQRTRDLEAHFEGLQRQFRAQADEKKAKLERDQAALQEFKEGTPDFESRRRELNASQADLQYFVESEGQKLELGLAQSLKVIFQDIQEAINTVAEAEGIDIVLAYDTLPTDTPRSSNAVRQQIMLQKVLYWKPEHDITEAVIAQLNKTYLERQKQDNAKGDAGDVNSDDAGVRVTHAGSTDVVTEEAAANPATDRAEVKAEAASLASAVSVRE
jgi:Skp family chaperone for outer membrane proteins